MAGVIDQSHGVKHTHPPSSRGHFRRQAEASKPDFNGSIEWTALMRK